MKGYKPSDTAIGVSVIPLGHSSKVSDDGVFTQYNL